MGNIYVQVLRYIGGYADICDISTRICMSIKSEA